MNKRLLLLPLVGILLALMVTAACEGNPRGDCVTVYFDGDVLRVVTDKEYCEQSCAQRISENPTLIRRCYFDGLIARPVAQLGRPLQGTTLLRV